MGRALGVLGNYLTLFFLSVGMRGKKSFDTSLDERWSLDDLVKAAHSDQSIESSPAVCFASLSFSEHRQYGKRVSKLSRA